MDFNKFYIPWPTLKITSIESFGDDGALSKVHFTYEHPLGCSYVDFLDCEKVLSQFLSKLLPAETASMYIFAFGQFLRGFNFARITCFPAGKNLLKVSKITLEQRPFGLCSSFSDYEQFFAHWVKVRKTILKHCITVSFCWRWTCLASSYTLLNYFWSNADL